MRIGLGGGGRILRGGASVGRGGIRGGVGVGPFSISGGGSSRRRSGSSGGGRSSAGPTKTELRESFLRDMVYLLRQGEGGRVVDRYVEDGDLSAAYMKKLLRTLDEGNAGAFSGILLRAIVASQGDTKGVINDAAQRASTARSAVERQIRARRKAERKAARASRRHERGETNLVRRSERDQKASQKAATLAARRTEKFNAKSSAKAIRAAQTKARQAIRHQKESVVREFNRAQGHSITSHIRRPWWVATAFLAVVPWVVYVIAPESLWSGLLLLAFLGLIYLLPIIVLFKKGRPALGVMSVLTGLGVVLMWLPCRHDPPFDDANWLPAFAQVDA